MPKATKTKNKDADNSIKFLGTAGARFVMIRQLRASGGLWIRANGTNVLVDPGPGCIVRCASARPKFDPGTLDGIIITHRHLDHANDINVMIEAMTEGGFKKRGKLLLPHDALADDPIVLQHTRNFVESIEELSAQKEYIVGNFRFMTGPRNPHPVETYGLKFTINSKTIGLIGDTAYYPEILDFYKCDIVIINVVFYQPRPGIEHLSFSEAKDIITALRPTKTILTHFGMTMLQAKPHILVEKLSQGLGLDIVAAYDGMTLIP